MVNKHYTVTWFLECNTVFIQYFTVFIQYFYSILQYFLQYFTIFFTVIYNIFYSIHTILTQLVDDNYELSLKTKQHRKEDFFSFASLCWAKSMSILAKVFLSK